MKRKIISVLLMLTIILSVFSAFDFSGFTADAADCSGDYEYITDYFHNNVTVTKYKGKDKNIVIPPEINGLPVVEIADYCFNGKMCMEYGSDSGLTKHPNRFYNRRIQSVTVPGTVKIIGEYAFGDMDRLQTVVLNEGLVTVNAYAFENCKELKTINLPDSLVNFNLLSFEGTSIEEIILGANVKRPVLAENNGTKVRRIICNADDVRFEKVSLGNNSLLEEIICNGKFNGIFSSDHSIKRIICNGGISYLTALSMASSGFELCCDAGGENVVYSAAESDKKKIYETNGFRYYVNEKSEAVITRYTGGESYVVVPEELNGYKVTAIAPLAFSTFTVDHIEYIKGNDGFIGENQILSVTLPDTVKTIGSFAFTYNLSLKSINIPSGIDKISKECFSGCKSVKEFLLPESVSVVENGAFEYCESLESIDLKNVTSIGNSAFENCGELYSITVSNNLKKIGDYAFYFCNLHGTYDFSSVEKIGKSAFAWNKSIKKVVLNEKLKRLEGNTFFNCNSLEEINLPSELVCIGDSCFYRTAVTDLIFGRYLKEIGSGAFGYCKLKGTLDLSTVEIIGEHAFGFNGNINKVILCDNLTALKYGTFQGCTELSEINFPSELVSISAHCFRNSGLSTAVFEEKLKEIGAGAFIDCKELSVIGFPEGIEKIGNFAFSGTSVKTLTVPENLSVIGYGAFQNCRGLETLYFNAVNCVVDEYMNNGEEIDFGNLADSSPFYGCNIKEIYLGEGVASIGGELNLYGTFESCAELEEIIIPDTVSQIGTAAFKNCASLQTAVISDSVTEIAEDAFEGCNNLTILCFKGSRIYEFAQNNGISVSTFLVAPIPNQTYTGKKITPEVSVSFSGNSLHKYIDFGVTYANNINVGEADVTVKGKGDYKNFSNRTRFTIVTKNISSAVISDIADQAYTGYAVTPSLTVTDSSNILKEGTDYTVSYSNNKKEGTARVEVTGKGNYSGSLNAEFRIVKMSGTENLLNRVFASIKSVFIKLGAFLAGIL